MKKDDIIALVKCWFRKAENDLKNACHTIKMKNPPTDTVCFHAQQCAEKYLKGILTLYQQPFPRTHSIEDLANLCEKIIPEMKNKFGDVEILSSYGVEIRFPHVVYYDVPSKDALQAIKLAKKIKFIVISHFKKVLKR